MATVPKPAQSIVRGGLAATYNGSLSTSDTYTVPNDGRTVLHFKKGSAVDCLVTIATGSTVDGLAVADRTVTVPGSSGDKFVGPFPRNVYGPEISFHCSNIAGLVFAAVRI